MPDNQMSATALLGQIPFGAVIGAPLKAAVEAQSAAAIACVDFIQSVGFEEIRPPAADGGAGAAGGGGGAAAGTALAPIPTPARRVREVTFLFKRLVAGQERELTITVPLLAIMPIPFLRIESMTVNFKASILAVDERSTQEKTSTDFSGAAEATVGFALWKASVKASVSSKKDSTATSSSKYSVEHTMDVSVHAVQDEMPAGLAKLLNFMTESIVATPKE
jgi:hypothetical protein